MKLSSLSIFFPAFNDSKTIAGLVREATKVAQHLTDDFEIVVANDGSSDNTREILGEIEASNERVRAIHHESNRGYGAALISGFAHSTKEWVFYTDGDAQYDVRDLLLLAKHATPGIGLVNGYKVSRADGWCRRIIGHLYHRTVKFIFGLPVRDTDCDFRLIHRSFVLKLHLESDSGAICVELIQKLHAHGCRIVELPVAHYQRVFGKSEFFRLHRISYTLSQLLRLWWELFVRARLQKISYASLFRPEIYYGGIMALAILAMLNSKSWIGF